MNFEEGRKPKRRKKRKRRTLKGMLLSLIWRLLLAAVIIAALLYILPVGIFMIEPATPLSPSSDLPATRMNVLLLGADKLKAGSQRTDTVIIASIGYGSVSLTSIMRDTIVDIPGHGHAKINAAFAYGGAELAMRTVNENFGLNVTRYALVDFTALADIVNALGGVDISITEKEQKEINKNMRDAWKMFRKMGYDKSSTSLVNLDFSKADENGCVKAHLDGIQALGYARIRSIDSDYNRTHRQRKLINASLRRFRAQWYNPIMLTRLIKTAFSRIDTNLNPVELMSLGMKAALCSDPGQLRLPVNGSFKDDGSALTNVNYDMNHDAFVEFVY